ncbi:hypothetical protein AVEN_13482-1 [Araneus ventricosus]|uniref:Uncharacterized protein n=1 Tax=Araneus ventricosus TaxID=182803 RepID=A0A4Y2NML5_ARAVE|nr:hypothetical protein AVEN_13482-1 [Araneus ventricosus]
MWLFPALCFPKPSPSEKRFFDFNKDSTAQKGEAIIRRLFALAMKPWLLQSMTRGLHYSFPEEFRRGWEILTTCLPFASSALFIKGKAGCPNLVF